MQELFYDHQLIKDAEAKRTGANAHDLNGLILSYKINYDKQIKGEYFLKKDTERFTKYEATLRHFVSTGELKDWRTQ